MRSSSIVTSNLSYSSTLYHVKVEIFYPQPNIPYSGTHESMTIGWVHPNTTTLLQIHPPLSENWSSTSRIEVPKFTTVVLELNSNIIVTMYVAKFLIYKLFLINPFVFSFHAQKMKNEMQALLGFAQKPKNPNTVFWGKRHHAGPSAAPARDATAVVIGRSPKSEVQKPIITPHVRR